jgi:hypothetical protein
MRLEPNHLATSFVSLMLAVAVGCGGDAGPARLPASGTITLDGKPLASGTITFIPGEAGPGAFGTIKDGSYRFGTADGPPPGRYSVEITDVRPTGKRVPDPDARTGMIEEVRNAIPPRYNARTELAVEVKKDADNTFRFDLSTRKLAARSARR